MRAGGALEGRKRIRHLDYDVAVLDAALERRDSVQARPIFDVARLHAETGGVPLRRQRTVRRATLRGAKCPVRSIRAPGTSPACR